MLLICRDEVVSTRCHVPVISNDDSSSTEHTNHPLKLEQANTPPRNVGKHSTSASTSNTTNTLQLSSSSSSTQQSPSQKLAQTSLPQTTSSNSANTSHISLTEHPPPSSSPSSSASAIGSAAEAMPPMTSQPPLLINTSNKHARGSVTASRMSQPSPITSAATGNGDDSSNNSSSSGNSHSSLQPQMLLPQTDAVAKGNENGMLTLSSYVQFMTLVSQSVYNIMH